MTRHGIRRLAKALALFFAVAVLAESASAQQVASLDALLQQTRDIRSREQAENRERERRFLQDRNRQAALLEEARAERAAEQAKSRQFSEQFDANEARLAELQEQLDAKVGTLGELFGAVRLAASDTAAVMHNSIISAQYPQRERFADGLAQSRELPTIEALEQLWFEMQREMTETGVVARFPGTVVLPSGTEVQRGVIRVGPFTAMSDGEFVSYVPETRRFSVLSRQPASRFREAAESLAESERDYERAVIDPTRGSLLSVLVQRPRLSEQIEHGGVVGYVIMVLAVAGLIVGLARLLSLAAIARKVAVQRKNLDKPRDNNPLGRVLEVYQDNRNADKETLQLKLDEAVLKEVPKLEVGLSALKILAAVGPLMGLLGTVTGMIITFQQITLFGTGDPKLMAGGISQALVTTVQGLVMAIPMLLMHSYLSARSGNLVQMLEEETAGLIAEQAEKQAAAGKAA